MSILYTILIDVSGSMGGNRLEYARLTLMLIMEMIFEINIKSKVRFGQPLIHFKVSKFSDSAEELISHKKSAKFGKSTSQRLILEMMDALQLEGGTNEAGAFKAMLDDIKKQKGPSVTVSKVMRMLSVIGDAQITSTAKDQIQSKLQANKKDKKKPVNVTFLPVGDESSKSSTVDTAGKENCIIPEKRGS